MPPRGCDIELVARANHGDAAAFEEIYRQYREFVFRIARQQLDSTDDALDVLQDTFMKLFAQFPGFELKVAMTSFLHPVVTNLCRNHHRRRRRRVAFAISSSVRSGPPLMTASSTSEVSLMCDLPPEQRDLLTLRFFEDQTLPELAETLGVPIGTVKSRLNRAIATLRAKLAGSDGR